MQKMSKGFYLGSYLVAGILGLIFCSIGWIVWPLLILGIPLVIYFFVVFCMFVHKAWSSIQDGHARTGPCKALGFLFIPFFNFYWIFQAYWGFAKDYNAYTTRHGINTAPKLPEGLFLAFCILTLVSLIPFVNFVTSIVNLVLFAVIISKVCDAVNALPSQSTKQNQK